MLKEIFVVVVVAIIIIIIIIVVVIIIIIIIITLRVLCQVLSIFQSEFCSEGYLVIPHLSYTIFSFPQVRLVAAYVFFLFLTFLLSSLHQLVLEGSFQAVSSPSFS